MNLKIRATYRGSCLSQQLKAAKDPVEWLPPNKVFWKKYAEAWFKMISRQNFNADAADLC